MRLIETADRQELSSLVGLVFDLDDTFLSHGKLQSSGYQALWALKDAGFVLIAATGRPAGWGDVLARMWPVDAFVSENGAIAHVASKRGLKLMGAEIGRGQRDPALEAIYTQVREEFPELCLTEDAHLRVSDITFDIGEHREIGAPTIAAVVRRAESLGARTTVSSVHLHLTLGQYDKATGCLRVLSEHFGYDTTRARMCFAFVGDSGNDAACFAAFRTSVGVANLTGRPTVPPRYLTRGARAEGFRELAELLIQSRS